MPGRLTYTRTGQPINNRAIDPEKCLGTKNAGTVFKIYDCEQSGKLTAAGTAAKAADAAAIAAGTIVDITLWLELILFPAADGQVAFNGDAAKVVPIYANTDNGLVLHRHTTQIVASVDCIVAGM